MENRSRRCKQFEQQSRRLQDRFENKVDKLQRGDELPPGVMKMVKVFVAVKRKLQPGDKMAGRHGNKGVISRIMPSKICHIWKMERRLISCLNPLGVPSRMNVGQILETHLGWAVAGLGVRSAYAAEAARATGDVQGSATAQRTSIQVTRFRRRIGSMDDTRLSSLQNLLAWCADGDTGFDGAREADIVDCWVMQACLPPVR